MITVLDLMSITKISPVSVDPLIAAVILLEKVLGGELKLKEKKFRWSFKSVILTFILI